MGKTPLHLVAENGYYVSLRLHEFDKHSNFKTDEIIKENLNIAKILINNGANIEIKDNAGFTPIYCAIRSGNRKVANLLMEKGANLKPSILILVYDEKKEFHALHIACYWGLYNISKKLIESGADVKKRMYSDKYYDSYQPIHFIASFCQKEWGHRNPKRIQVIKRKRLIAKLLISKGVYINSKTQTGLTPLDIANEEGCPDISKMLKEMGAKNNKY